MGGGRMGAGIDGQAQHKVLFLLPGWQGKAQGPGGQILPRSVSESVSVLCKGNAISMENFCSSCSLLQWHWSLCCCWEKGGWEDYHELEVVEGGMFIPGAFLSSNQSLL